jgi:predicted nucleic acid-binding protein
MRRFSGVALLGRQWLASHHTIDNADLAIAATAIRSGSRLLTRNVRHFPMFTDLHPPY